MAFLISFEQIVEGELGSSCEVLKPEFDKLLLGTISLPLNIPGTNYYQGLQVHIKIYIPKSSFDFFTHAT